MGHQAWAPAGSCGRQLAAAAIFLGRVVFYLFGRPGAYEVVWLEASRT